jgi:phosphatidylglycerol---prolipoprotein diacylglyceryl transferase
MTSPAYSLFMLLALGVFLLARRLQPSTTSLPAREQLALGLAAFIGGTFAARLPFVFPSDEPFFSRAAWLADGKTVTTGLAGAYLAVELTKWWMGIRAKTGDALAVPLAAALAIGRWGCFCNGCCSGVPTDLPWGVDFGDGVPRHPTQVYESLFHAAMAGVLLVIARRRLIPHQRLKLYLIAYCAYRFLTEFIRPEPRLAGGLTFYQWFVLPCAATLAVQWWYDARQLNRGKNATDVGKPAAARV